MTRRDDERREAFGDAVYDAWRQGYNSDHVSMDRVYDDVDRGCTRDEAASREVGRLRDAAARARAAREEEEQWAYEEERCRQEQDEAEYVRSQCASGGHAYAGEDRVGRPSCYCGVDDKDGLPQQEGPQNGCTDCGKNKSECPCIPF